MLSLYEPIKNRADSGEFLAPGGYKVLHKLIETFESQYKSAEESEEMGPKFFEVQVKFQEEVVTFYL
jgi:hypothetical protein